MLTQSPIPRVLRRVGGICAVRLSISKDGHANQLVRAPIGLEDVAADGAARVGLAFALPLLQQRHQLRLRAWLGAHAVDRPVTVGHVYSLPRMPCADAALKPGWVLPSTIARAAVRTDFSSPNVTIDARGGSPSLGTGVARAP